MITPMKKLSWLLVAVVASANLLAFEPDPVKVRVSVKRVISSAGARPSGLYGSATEITRVINKCNDVLADLGANWTIVLTEVVDTPAAASGFYSISSGALRTLETQAKADPTNYLWRTDAINIYVADTISDAGGVCSFPTIGPHREVIVINSQGILGGSEGWLHEMGHYFNLIHTHEGDVVADTIEDTDLPSPYDCSVHDDNFIASAPALAATAGDRFKVLHNVMSYHCDPQALTDLQIVRMRRALFDYRQSVLVARPLDAVPVAEIRLPATAIGGRVELTGASVELELDGSFSRDGDGGSGFTGRWILVSGPAGGSRFLTAVQGWDRGPSGIGYGDDDDLTELTDMQGRYLTVYLTREFQVPDPARLETLTLDIAYDDGYAVYLNGENVSQDNLPANPGPLTEADDSLELARKVVDLTPHIGKLLTGSNRVSVEVHNSASDSSDLTIHPVLTAKETDDDPVVLIPSRAVWFYRKGSQGAPPADWKTPGFDAPAARVKVAFSQSGTYKFRLTVDDGLPPNNTAAAEVDVVVTEGGFIRGDCNLDFRVDLADAVKDLAHLFLGAGSFPCADACDATDDGTSDVSDALALLNYLFRGGDNLPAPFPLSGDDPTADALGCE